MFPGVRPGDQWCLCASRYAQLLEIEANGAVRDAQGQPVTDFVPKVYLQACHEKSLEHVPLEVCLHADDARAATRKQSCAPSGATHVRCAWQPRSQVLMANALDADEAKTEIARVDALRAQLGKSVAFDVE